MAAIIISRSLCQKSRLFNKFLVTNSATLRILPRCFSTPTTPENYVPAKVPTQDELTPAEKAEMSEDLDGSFLFPSFKNQMEALGTDIQTINQRLPHPIWSKEELENFEYRHTKPEKFIDKAAHATVMILRSIFDLCTGYSLGFQNEQSMLRRCIILETVAGVPGMIGALNRHLASLRKMKKDYGWIHTLLEEAENERMHLMVVLGLKKPSFMIRFFVVLGQAIFCSWYTLMYAISPKYCHRFVAYLEEQACHTYTNIVNKIDEGELPGFLAPAPLSSIKYWRLDKDATLREVFQAIRADENHHREVNHTFAEMEPNSTNPFPPGF